MRKLSHILMILAVCAMMFGVNSCIFDAKEEAPKPDDDKPPAFLPLDKRDNVLANLKTAYVQGRLDEYSKILDGDFTFFFGATDIQEGNVNVPQWDRAAELGSTQNLFDPSFSPPNGDPVSSISLTMTFPQGEDKWQQQQPSDQIKYPGEVWYEKTVDYILSVVAGETTFTNANPIKASFVVRQSEVDGKMIWRIIEWRDDI